MPRRSAVTLVEVLVAIFIMAIGLLALLTLFPLGMLRMAQAIRDDRAATCGRNAHTLSIMQNLRNDPWVISDQGTGGSLPDLFVNPIGAPTLPDANPYGESYPIFVDPPGYLAAPAGPAQDWVGGVTPAFGGTLRRRPVQFAGLVQANIFKSFTLGDDINFDGTTIPGAPQTSAGGNVLRDTRYSWGYVLRRPQASDRSIVDCSVLVFDQRISPPVELSASGSLTLAEYVYPNKAAFNPSNNTITIDYNNNVPPPLRAGDWVMDGSLNSAYTLPCAAHSYFYRVVAIQELGGNVATYEVQNTIRGFNTAVAMPASGYPGTAIIIRGIVEVFDKGPVRLP